MKARVVSDAPLGQMIEVLVANDPFTSWVDRRQVVVVKSTQQDNQHKEEHKMPTATAKELRKQARTLGIEGWEEMDREELEEAIAAEAEDAEEEVEDEEVEETPAPRARKTSTKKAPAKKAPATKKSAGTRPAAKKAAASKTASTKKAAPAKASTRRAAAAEEEDEEGDNPFRVGSNLYLMTEELMKGGKRSRMVAKLRNKVDLKPRTRGGRNFDIDAEIDYKLVRTCQVLTNEHGFVIEKDGRGTDQTVKAIPPSQQ
jgi:hypothetical protein